MDEQILKTVQSMLGDDVKILDCEVTSTMREEEIILINNVPIKLEGDDGQAFKEAILNGQAPSCDLLNQLLFRAGILLQPVHLETALSVKSTIVTTEDVTVSRAGQVIDEKSTETKENNCYTSECVEVWEPIIHRPDSVDFVRAIERPVPPPRRHTRNTSSTSTITSDDCPGPAVLKSSEASSFDSGHDDLFSGSFIEKPYFTTPLRSLSSSSCCFDSMSLIADYLDDDQSTIGSDGIENGNQKPVYLKSLPQQKLPTIFGTVTADQLPKQTDSRSRTGLPQTSQGSGSKLNCDGTLTDRCSDTTDQTLVYRDGNLISGSLDALIRHMVPTVDYYPEKSYIFAFLLSARLFIRPHELLTKIITVCDEQNALGAGDCVSSLIQMLHEWLDTFPYDFRDDRLQRSMIQLTDRCVRANDQLRSPVQQMLQSLRHRLTVLDQYEEFLLRLNFTQPTTTPTQIDESDIGIQLTDLCTSSRQLAHQLTHIELERLSHIGPEEFVQAFAKDNYPHLEQSVSDIKKTKNLESYVQWFNRLSYLVATEIVKLSKKKLRVRLIEYWIETARECFNIGNFNSLMAIIAGLNMSPISRLKKTWSKVQSAKFSVLEHQMDPTSNFNSYRSTLKAAMWRSAGATDERQRIVIPFFSLLVKDLYFLNEGCSNKLPNGHINFEKFWQLAKQVTEFVAWKQVTCPFDRAPGVAMYLQTNPILNENTLAMASFECEPPDNNQEKDRFKALKTEQQQV